MIVFKGLLTVATVAASIYSAICVGLYFFQTKLIFKPTAVLTQTPEERQLDYQEVWIDAAGKAAPGRGLHGWWPEAT